MASHQRLVTDDAGWTGRPRRLAEDPNGVVVNVLSHRA
jgi:hypothetical protein